MRLPYALARNALFCLDAERAHDLTLAGLAAAPALAGWMGAGAPAAPVQAMGLTFPNPVGLAAGLDKNARCLHAWQAMGFGFVEVGTVTPRPQPGNPKPRMFRLPKQQAIINRLGFNNDGVDALVARVKKARSRGFERILGINIGKNFDTPIEQAAQDYRICLQRVYSVADYVTVNISSPNTRQLRDLQQADALDDLLGQLQAERKQLCQQHQRRVPLVLKIAPDLDAVQIQAIARSLLRYDIDAVIATNTTLARTGLEGVQHAQEQGGLSGAPLLATANQVLAQLHQQLQGQIPVIAVGGVMRGKDALAKRQHGAALLQLYSGFIYHGPQLIVDCIQAWQDA